MNAEAVSDDFDEPVEEIEVTRLMIRVVAAVVAVLLAASLATVSQAADAESGFDTMGASSTTSAEVIGPLPGTEIDGYLTDRAGALRRTLGAHVAAVSFTVYLGEPAARRLLDDFDVDVEALLVAPRGGRPELVGGSLEGWAADAADDAREERRELEKILPTVDDPEFEAQYRADIARLKEVERGIDADDALVFGAVVQADGDVLRGLAETSGIRLVDVGGEDLPHDDAVRGIRPEEATRAGEPPTRPR